MTTIRVIVLGGPQVGKSALTVRYLTGRFIGEYTSESDVLYTHQVNVDEEKLKVEILDCCAQKERIVDADLVEQIGGGDAYVIVYSICDKNSFNQVPNFIKYIKEIKSDSEPRILILGNKSDLQHQRDVTHDCGVTLAQNYGCQFYEVSAANGFSNIQAVFHGMLRDIKWFTKRKVDKRPRRRNSLRKIMKVLISMFGARKNCSETNIPTMTVLPPVQ